MAKLNNTTSFDFLEYGNASHAFVKKEIHKEENFITTRYFNIWGSPRAKGVGGRRG